MKPRKPSRSSRPSLVAGDWTGNPAGADSDRLDGGDADDASRGSEASDWIRGGPGNDEIPGGDGRDLLHGGDGRDTFVRHDSVIPGAGLDDPDVFVDFTPPSGDQVKKVRHR